MDGDWELVESNPQLGLSRYRLDLGTHYVYRTEYLYGKALLEENERHRNAMSGQKWGDAALVARIPMNVLMNQKTGLYDAITSGDDKYLNKVLNDADNRAFRTREGTL